MNSICIKAYGKINLALDVMGKREDGYHEVAMIMQGIELHDTIKIQKNISQNIELSCNKKELENGPENLAYQAAELLLNDFSTGGIKIHIDKRIPVAAGLAGGSTDAAAVLLGMNKLFNLQLSLTALQKYAELLGSDVPFCLNPLTSLATGRGERIKRLAECPKLWMVLYKPPFGVSTKDVYSHLQKITIKKRPDLNRITKAIEEKNRNGLYNNMVNVLEYATFDLYPNLGEWAKEINTYGGLRVMMSGSGPTLIAFVEDRNEALEMASMWRDKYKWDIIVSRTIEPCDLDRRMVVYE